MNEELKSKIIKMPKVELHMHLDGSIPIDYIKRKYNFTDEDIKDKLVANEKCHDLNDYLTRFDFPISIMQTKEELSEIVIELLKKLKEQNVVYVEIRFAPQFHTSKGLTQDEVVKIVIEASKKVDIKSNFILCAMRSDSNRKENLETVDVAKKYLGKGVCAVDLAGAEAIFKTKEFKYVFDYASKLNIPYTIHAGEADGIESIKSAIEFGAKRLGHGVRITEDKETMDFVRDKKITLEVCPTSNIQTCICNSYASHPLEKLYKYGINTTINTDNMTVSYTTLANEYMSILDETNLTLEDLVIMNKNSVNSAFISDEEKKDLLKKYWEE